MSNPKEELKARTHQAQMNVMIGAGKEMARSLLRDAEATAENPQQLSAQVFTVQVAGCHILALCAFQQEQQGGNGDDWLDETVKQIKADLENIRLAHEKSTQVETAEEKKS